MKIILKQKIARYKQTLSQDGRSRLLFHGNPAQTQKSVQTLFHLKPSEIQWAILSAFFEQIICYASSVMPLGERKKITLLRFIFPASGRSAYTTNEKVWMSSNPVPVTVIFLPPLKDRIKKEVKSLANNHSYRLLYPIASTENSYLVPIWQLDTLHKGLLLKLLMTTPFKRSNINFKLILKQQNKKVQITLSVLVADHWCLSLCGLLLQCFC